MQLSRFTIWDLRTWGNTKTIKKVEAKINFQGWLQRQTLNQGLQRQSKLWMRIKTSILKANNKIYCCEVRISPSKVWPKMKMSKESKMPNTTRRTWSRRTSRGFKKWRRKEIYKPELMSSNGRKLGRNKKNWRTSFYKKHSNIGRKRKNKNKINKKITSMSRPSLKDKRRKNNNKSLQNRTRRRGRSKCW